MNTLLDRFLRYVKIDTQSDENSPTSPSTAKQLVLSHLLENECRSIGLEDVSCGENGIVMATIPSTVAHQAPTIFWNSHIDTSPEYSGSHVNPVVHPHYDGEDIILSKDPSKKILVSDNPALRGLIDTTIITTDGTTLLGADDKSGIAIIMTAADFLQSHPEIPHGPIRICFTVDEEIGRGIVGLDLKKLNSLCGYTVDGKGVGIIDHETFSADLATVTVTGINSHPSEAKAKGMVNAVKILSQYLVKLPSDSLSPELTEDRGGFVHPYHIEGGVAQAQAKILLRDFETQKLKDYADLLHTLAKELSAKYPKAKIEVTVQKQYRNMREGLQKEPRAVAFAIEAMRTAGLQPECHSIRGGTDGAHLTEQGFPCPNLSSGQHNLHSPLEWTSLKEMEKSVEVLIELAKLWGKTKVEIMPT